MRYPHIVFDMDGTLVDTERGELRALQRALRETLGEERPIDFLRPVFGTTGRVGLANLGYTPAQVDAVYPLWYDYSAAAIGKNPLFAGMRETLDALRARGCALGIVTSRKHELIDVGLRTTGLEACFGVCIGAEDTEKHKPDPDPLLAYLARTGAAAAETLYVGDSRYDMACAAAAGVDSALALWGTQDKTLACTHRLERPGDLLALL